MRGPGDLPGPTRQARLRTWRDRAQASLLGRTAARFVAVSGYDRSLALATQSFVALVPAALLAVAYLPESGRRAAGARLVDGLGLSGESADAVLDLVARPPTTSTPSVVVGIVLVVMTGVGFTRTLQRVYVAAWVLPPLGARGVVHGMVAVLVLVAAVVAAVGLHPGGVGGPLLSLAIQIGLAVSLWLPVQRLLLGGRVSWRALLPGAAVAGAGQAVVMAASGLYFRVALGSQAEVFGVIGAAFVMVSWLVVLAYLLVGAAVLSAELAGAPPVGAAATVPR